MIIDLTHTITPDTFVYPGTPSPAFSATRTIARDGARETLLQVGSHTGTHMDAPRHILPDGSGLDRLPPSQFCGRAAVIDVSHLGAGGVVTADLLREQNGYLRSADYALFYTGWEKKWDTPAFLEEPFPVLDDTAAKYLVSCGLKGVGTDAISVDPLSDDGFHAHHILLSGGLVIVENLCLKKVVGRKDVMFFALPVKFENADGAPVRAIAEFRDFPEGMEKEMEQA
jgi:kynurenine formamidase